MAVEACKVINDQATYSRRYFKLIKDYGGFSLFSKKKAKILVGKPNPAPSVEQQSKATEPEQSDKPPTTPNPILKESCPMDTSSQLATANSDNDIAIKKGEEEDWSLDNGSMGPVMM